MYQIHRVDQRIAEDMEPLGAKPKFWFTRDGKRWLFKREVRGTGEDWAEKVACELCELLGLPHVIYELAELWVDERYVQPGVICENFAPPPLYLVLGNQLLLNRDPNYPAAEARKYKVAQHTVDAVALAVGSLKPPSAEWMPAAPPGIASALDVFVGYVMLDAWIANQDRHHQNWAALRDDETRLAPTFDHGASLARNMKDDDERVERLTTKDSGRTLLAFAARATSAFYANTTAPRPLRTLDAFGAFKTIAPTGAACWLARLAAIDSGTMEKILNEVPPKRMSGIAKKFTLELLRINQQRLLKQS